MKKIIIGMIISFFFYSFAFAQVIEKEVTVKVKGLVCSFCAFSLDKSFKKLDEVEKIEVELDKKEVYIDFKEGKSLSDEIITKTIVDAGYNVTKIMRNNEK